MLDAKCTAARASDDVGGSAGPVERKGYISAMTSAVDDHGAFVGLDCPTTSWVTETS